MANPIAVPGLVVPSSSLISPGGAQGLQGLQGTTALASSTQSGLLQQTSGNTTDFIDGTNNSQPLQPVIWSARLRSFSSVGNPTFEVNQRAPGVGFTNPAAATFLLDRWQFQKSALTATVNAGQAPAPFVVPGTSYRITNNYLSLTLTGQQASLAAGDYLELVHVVEGTQMRELIGDVHSLSLLVKCTLPLKFSVVLLDANTTWSLAKLCTIPAANTPTLIQLPNLPIWTPSGTFNTGPGTVGYIIRIGLCAGSTFIPSANDVWVSGSGGVGAIGMDNFASKPVNTEFDIAFIQHEPGQCTQLMDVPFGQNLDGPMGCSRYYSKTYDIGTAPGTATSNGIMALFNISVSGAMSFGARLRKTMAKTPTVTIYDHNNGAVNSILDAGAVHHAVSGVLGNSTEVPFYQVTTSGLTVASNCWCHYTADTGW
jgi:hypothetical protein